MDFPYSLRVAESPATEPLLSSLSLDDAPVPNRKRLVQALGLALPQLASLGTRALDAAPSPGGCDGDEQERAHLLAAVALSPPQTPRDTHEPAPILTLPLETLLEIFLGCSGRELLAAQRVCKAWHALITSNEYLWRHLCLLAGLNAAWKPAERSFVWLYFSAHRQFVPAASQSDEAAAAAAMASATGVGVVVFPSMGRYEGELEDGKRHGYGRLVYRDESWFCGHWVANEKNGHGVYWLAHGETYDGNWLNDRKHGHGVLKWREGDIYDGEWDQDRKEGKGTYKWPSGNQYSGDWHNDKMHGYGVKMWSGGDVYRGAWVSDARTGTGEYTWRIGDVYSGDLLDGKEHGHGTYNWVDGRSYVGEWLAGNEEGAGVFTWPDGTKYTGFWRRGLRHGHGEMEWADSSRPPWRGIFADDVRVDEHGAPIKQKAMWDEFFLQPFIDQRLQIRQVFGGKGNKKLATSGCTPSPKVARK